MKKISADFIFLHYQMYCTSFFQTTPDMAGALRLLLEACMLQNVKVPMYLFLRLCWWHVYSMARYHFSLEGLLLVYLSKPCSSPLSYMLQISLWYCVYVLTGTFVLIQPVIVLHMLSQNKWFAWICKIGWIWVCKTYSIKYVLNGLEMFIIKSVNVFT